MWVISVHYRMFEWISQRYEKTTLNKKQINWFLWHISDYKYSHHNFGCKNRRTEVDAKQGKFLDFPGKFWARLFLSFSWINLSDIFEDRQVMSAYKPLKQFLSMMLNLFPWRFSLFFSESDYGERNLSLSLSLSIKGLYKRGEILGTRLKQLKVAKWRKKSSTGQNSTTVWSTRVRHFLYHHRKYHFHQFSQTLN